MRLKKPNYFHLWAQKPLYKRVAQRCLKHSHRLSESLLFPAIPIQNSSKALALNNSLD